MQDFYSTNDNRQVSLSNHNFWPRPRLIKLGPVIVRPACPSETLHDIVLSVSYDSKTWQLTRVEGMSTG